MKKIITLLLTALLLFVPVMTSCGKTAGPKDLPVMEVTVLNGSKINSRDEYEEVTITVTGSEDGEFDIEEVPADMKCRGNSTFHLPKLSYRIKFNEKINLMGQGAGPEKSWVLLANYSDLSSLRTHISFAMGRKLDNIGFTSSSSFVRLYMNGKYKGVYQLAEHHNDGENRIVMNEDPEEPDTDYLIEMDEYQKSRGMDIPYSFETGDRAYVIKSDNMTQPKWRFIYEYFKTIDAAMVDADQDEIEKLIDLPSFIDTYILEEISKDHDAGISSFFFLKKAGGKLYCTCPWDFDIAYGNDHLLDNGSPEGIFVGNPAYLERDDEGYECSVWYSSLMSRKWFVDMVCERWEEVRDILEKTALDEIDMITACYTDEFFADMEYWHLDYSAEAWLESTAGLRDWVVARFDFLDSWFSDPETRYSFAEK